MRLEATVPDSRGTAIVQLAEKLGLSRSQMVDEALALFLKAVVEIRRGHRLVTVEPGSSEPACELATPTLAALESAMQPQELKLSPRAVAKVNALADKPPAAGARLRAAAKRHARWRRRVRPQRRRRRPASKPRT